MKDIAPTLAVSLLLQAIGSSGFGFGRTDYHDDVPYDLSCIQEALAPQYDDINEERERDNRNEIFAICLIQRNSIAQMLMKDKLWEIQNEPVQRGSKADALRVVAVDGGYSYTPDTRLDNDGQAQAKIQDILLMVAEMCDRTATNDTPLINSIRNCGNGSPRDFQACACARRTGPKNVIGLQNCIFGLQSGFHGQHLPQFLDPRERPPPDYTCSALGIFRPQNRRTKGSRTNKRSIDDDSEEISDDNEGTGDDGEEISDDGEGTGDDSDATGDDGDETNDTGDDGSDNGDDGEATGDDSNSDSDDGTDDTTAECYLIYENGEVEGTTGPQEDCDFSDDYPSLTWYDFSSYTDYAIASSHTVTDFPGTGATATATAVETLPTISVPSAVLQPSATDAAQSAAQSSLYKMGSSAAGPTATPSGKKSAAGSLRNPRGRRGLEIAAVVLCLGVGAYLY